MPSLDGELVVDVADREPLSVDRAERDSPLFLGNAGQLRDVSGRLNMNMVSSRLMSRRANQATFIPILILHLNSVD